MSPTDDYDDLLDDFEKPKKKVTKKKVTKKKATKKEKKVEPQPEEDEIDIEFEGDEDEEDEEEEEPEPFPDEDEEEEEEEEEEDEEDEEEEEEEEEESLDIDELSEDIDIEDDGDIEEEIEESDDKDDSEEGFFIDTSQEGQYDKDFEKDYDEPTEQPRGPIIITNHGRKGKGKTAASISSLYAIKGKGSKKKKLLLIELDKKAKPIKRNLFKNDPRIMIEDASKYMKFRPAAAYLEACDKTIQYIFFLLNKYKDRKDIGVVIIDALEVFLRDTEGRIRHIGNRPLTGGVNWELWNIRLLDIQEILNICKNMASHYIFFNTKTRTARVKDDNDQETEIEVIKWHSAIEDETDNVFKCTTMRDAEGELHFMIHAETCKEEIQTGAYLDVTGKKAYPHLIKEAPLEKIELK